MLLIRHLLPSEQFRVSLPAVNYGPLFQRKPPGAKGRVATARRQRGAPRARRAARLAPALPRCSRNGGACVAAPQRSFADEEGDCSLTGMHAAAPGNEGVWESVASEVAGEKTRSGQTPAPTLLQCGDGGGRRWAARRRPRPLRQAGLWRREPGGAGFARAVAPP